MTDAHLRKLSQEIVRRSAQLVESAHEDWRIAAWLLSMRYPERWGPPDEPPTTQCREYAELLRLADGLEPKEQIS